MVIVSGLPGVGKSTVSEMISRRIGAEHLRTDSVRDDLFQEPQYDSEENRATYRELCSRAADELERGNSVVLDATFSDRSRREDARELAQSTGSDVLFLKVKASEEVVEERLASRQDDASEADYRVYREKKQSFDELPENVDVIDNSGQLRETRRAVENVLTAHPELDATD